MKLKTILGTIMTFVLILIVGTTNSRVTFAKKMIEVDIDSSYILYELRDLYEAFKTESGTAKAIDVTPKNKGVLVAYDTEIKSFRVEFKKPGTYNLKFKFDKGKSETATFKVIDFIKRGKAIKSYFMQDGEGNDVLEVFGNVNRSIPNINIKLGDKAIIKNVAIGSGFKYVFKKGYLEKIKFSPDDTKKIKYEIVKGSYDSINVSVDKARVEDGVVTAIKLSDWVKGYEGYITIGDSENADMYNYFTGELYTIKLNSKESGEWVELEKGIPEDRLFVTNYLYKPIKKKKK